MPARPISRAGGSGKSREDSAEHQIIRNILPWILIRNLILMVLLLGCLALHRVASSQHLCRSGHGMPPTKTWSKWRWDVEGLVSARTWGFKSPSDTITELRIRASPPLGIGDGLSR